MCREYGEMITIGRDDELSNILGALRLECLFPVSNDWDMIMSWRHTLIPRGLSSTLSSMLCILCKVSSLLILTPPTLPLPLEAPLAHCSLTYARSPQRMSFPAATKTSVPRLAIVLLGPGAASFLLLPARDSPRWASESVDASNNWWPGVPLASQAAE